MFCIYTRDKQIGFPMRDGPIYHSKSTHSVLLLLILIAVLVNIRIILSMLIYIKQTTGSRAVFILVSDVTRYHYTVLKALPTGSITFQRVDKEKLESLLVFNTVSNYASRYCVFSLHHI